MSGSAEQAEAEAQAVLNGEFINAAFSHAGGKEVKNV